MLGRASRILAVSALGAALSSTAGCLSLGGTTNHVHDDPDLKARVSSLESRVGTLESVLTSSAHIGPE
jgi:hypothetical protein